MGIKLKDGLVPKSISVTAFLMVSVLTSSVYPHEGYPISLFRHVSTNSYELLADGSDSYVLQLDGVQSFYENVATSKKPVVVKFFSKKSQKSADTVGLFQDIASKNNKNLKFASFDIESDKNMTRRLAGFFIKLAMSLQKPNGEQSVELAKIAELVRLMAALEQLNDASPFVLFFKEGHLIFPETFYFTEVDKLNASLDNQLIKSNSLTLLMNSNYKVKLFNAKKRALQEPEKKPSWWRKVKKIFKNIWSK